MQPHPPALEEEGGARATQLALSHDSDAVTKNVSFIPALEGQMAHLHGPGSCSASHEVGGQQHGAVLFVLDQQVPGGSPSIWIHS